VGTPLSLIDAASSGSDITGAVALRAWWSSDSTSLLKGTKVRGDASMMASTSALENFMRNS